jgi:hypothetical protein
MVPAGDWLREFFRAVECGQGSPAPLWHGGRLAPRKLVERITELVALQLPRLEVRETVDDFRMRGITYFLILATVWAQFDDVLLAPASALLSAPLADDDDEYVSSCSQEQQSWLVSLGQQQPVSATAQLVAGLRVGTSLRSECRWPAPLALPPIYLFISLQI